MCVGVNVALADFKKAAAGREDRQSLGDCIAGQRIQHQVNAGAFGDAANFFREGSGARIHYVANAEAAQESAFLVAACGCENLPRLRKLRDLDRCKPDSAGCCMNQYFFAAPDFAEIVQRVPGSHEGDGNGGGLLMRESRRLGQYKCGGDGDMGCEASGAACDDLVANLEIADALANCNDAPGTLVANEYVAIGVERIDAEQLHDVAEVEGGCVDLDFDFARAGLAAVNFIKGELIHDAGHGQIEAISGIWGRRRRGGMQFKARGRNAIHKIERRHAMRLLFRDRSIATP